jgi:quercetin dioxygenase-like cupin family protein
MTESVDITAVRSNWQSRGFSCDVWSAPPGRVWNDYRHAVDEVVMVLEGKVEFDIAGRVIRPAPGEEVLIPAGHPAYRAKPRQHHVSVAIWLPRHRRLIRCSCSFLGPTTVRCPSPA